MKKWVGRAALAALGALVVYVALAALADVRALRASLLGFEWRALVLALAIVLAGYVVRALRWRLYLHRLAVHGPVGREALGFAASLTMGLASGKSGQVIKAYYLQLATGLPYSVSVPVTFAERIADAVSVLLLLALGLVLAPTLERAPSALAALALVALLLALRHPRAPAIALRPIRRLGWVARHERALLDGHARMRAHLTLRELAAPAVLGLVAYLFEALALQVLARGMGHDVGFGLAVLAIALADVAGMLSFIPGGIGVAEGGLMIVLTLHGMPLADATVLTLLFRLCTLWFGLSLGAAAAAALEVGARRAGRKA